MLGLISTLNTARKGMNASQASINVTSHNIANANTEGYSRQRVNLVTSRPFCTPSMTNAAEPGQMGTGVDIASIDRIRNSFLDYQVRSETSNKGKYDVRQQFLSNIEAVMNEPTESAISNAMSEFYSAWQSLSNAPESSETRTSVAQKSIALTDMLNNTYNQFEKLKEDVHETTKTSVFELNSYLDQLDSVNQEIMQISISGQAPNDLEDRRDLLLDKLSKIFNINVDKGQPYNGENILPVDITGITEPTLVKSVQNTDGIKRFSYVNSIEMVGADSYKVTYYKNGDTTKASNKVEMTVSMTAAEAKQLDECRVLWANKDGEAIDFTNQTSTIGATATFSQLALFSPSAGEICGQISTQTDINNYEDSLNALAKTIALSVNAVHDGNDSSKLAFFTNSDSTGTEDTITAGNITVNSAIISDVTKIKVSTNGNVSLDGTGDGKRALAIAQLKDMLLNIQSVTLPTMTRAAFIAANNNSNTSLDDTDSNGVLTFKSQSSGMKVNSYFNDIISKLGVQVQEANKVVENKESLLATFKTQRDSVSGVSIDEEMGNLIQYQHAYSANAKIISTVDELLDVVVNSLKR
ncbi:MAG: flagellar hook-associated protein FlgK [Clostridiaceae bacterium]